MPRYGQAMERGVRYHAAGGQQTVLASLDAKECQSEIVGQTKQEWPRPAKMRGALLWLAVLLVAGALGKACRCSLPVGLCGAVYSVSVSPADPTGIRLRATNGFVSL